MTYTLAAAERLVDQVRHVVDQEENRTVQAVGSGDEAAELDRSRRYLRPVRAMSISDDPEGVHLAVYSWLPVFGAWATGPGLCGESMRQGALPEGTPVTCARCEAWRPRYERMLAPGYRAEDDDPEVLRKRIDRAQELHPAKADWSWATFGCTHGGKHEARCATCGTCSPCPTLDALSGEEG
jgi:hypothetical protein